MHVQVQVKICKSRDLWLWPLNLTFDFDLGFKWSWNGPLLLHPPLRPHNCGCHFTNESRTDRKETRFVCICIYLHSQSAILALSCRKKIETYRKLRACSCSCSWYGNPIRVLVRFQIFNFVSKHTMAQRCVKRSLYMTLKNGGNTNKYAKSFDDDDDVMVNKMAWVDDGKGY